MEDFGLFDDTEVVWGKWEKKFAVLPTKISNGKIWFKSYYRRYGRSVYVIYIQRGTLFDVMKGNNESR